MEIELKYACPTPERLEEILGAPEVQTRLLGPVQTIRMQTTYFDTPELALRARRWTLRKRLENGKCITTFKGTGTGEGALRAHGEWETPSEKLEEALPVLLAQGAPAELKELAHAGFEPICGAEFTRRSALMQLPEGAVAELCCDEGSLLGRTARAPLCEVELELKQGKTQTLLTFGEQFSAHFGLQPEQKSKLARAAALD